jgi:hypothetical protein
MHHSALMYPALDDTSRLYSLGSPYSVLHESANSAPPYMFPFNFQIRSLQHPLLHRVFGMWCLVVAWQGTRLKWMMVISWDKMDRELILLGNLRR